MANGVLALVGTRKGLFLLRGDDDRRGWRVDGPLLAGWGVYHATVDARDGTLYAAANHLVYGPTVQRSADGGKTWQRSTVGEALQALPVADLLFNERGEWSRHLNVFVDGPDACERGGPACPLSGG